MQRLSSADAGGGGRGPPAGSASFTGKVSCAGNTPLIFRLLALRAKLGDKMAFAITKAVNSIQKCPLLIKNGRQAEALEGVGSTLAGHIDRILADLSQETLSSGQLPIVSSVSSSSSSAASSRPAPLPLSVLEKKRKNASATAAATKATNTSLPNTLRPPALDDDDDDDCNKVLSDDSLTAVTKKKRAKQGPRPPKPRTGAWALLMALYDHTQSARAFDAPLHIGKTALIELARPLSDTSFDKDFSAYSGARGGRGGGRGGAAPGASFGGYTAWDSMNKQLVKNQWVNRYSNPAKFELTAAGEAVAAQLWADKRLQDPSSPLGTDGHTETGYTGSNATSNVDSGEDEFAARESSSLAGATFTPSMFQQKQHSSSAFSESLFSRLTAKSSKASSSAPPVIICLDDDEDDDQEEEGSGMQRNSEKVHGYANKPFESRRARAAMLEDEDDVIDAVSDEPVSRLVASTVTARKGCGEDRPASVGSNTGAQDEEGGRGGARGVGGNMLVPRAGYSQFRRVVLLLDVREVLGWEKGERTEFARQMALGDPYTGRAALHVATRQLAVGDMAWVAAKESSGSENSLGQSNGGGKGGKGGKQSRQSNDDDGDDDDGDGSNAVEELMLDCIVERKTLKDLVASIKVRVVSFLLAGIFPLFSSSQRFSLWCIACPAAWFVDFSIGCCHVSTNRNVINVTGRTLFGATLSLAEERMFACYLHHRGSHAGLQQRQPWLRGPLQQD